jgi:hypothetical protein
VLTQAAKPNTAGIINSRLFNGHLTFLTQQETVIEPLATCNAGLVTLENAMQSRVNRLRKVLGLACLKLSPV